MAKRKNNNGNKKMPVVAPGYNDEKFGEYAGKEDVKKGNSTKVTRLFLEENDPT